MTVGSFDPTAATAALNVDVIRELFDLLDGETLKELSQEQISTYAPLVTHSEWADCVGGFSADELVQLIRVFTLGEQRYSAWTADDKSAVIVLVRELKARGVYDKELTRWIKSESSNKFLPHGSLLDRL